MYTQARVHPCSHTFRHILSTCIDHWLPVLSTVSVRMEMGCPHMWLLLYKHGCCRSGCDSGKLRPLLTRNPTAGSAESPRHPWKHHTSPEEGCSQQACPAQGGGSLLESGGKAAWGADTSENSNVHPERGLEATAVYLDFLYCEELCA